MAERAKSAAPVPGSAPAAPTPPRWRRAQRALRQSLRLRLMLLFALLALALSAAFMGGMQRALSVGWRDAARPLVVDYVDRLVADLGSPPSVERAQALVERLPIALSISGPVVNWQSDPGPREAPWGQRRWRGWGPAGPAPDAALPRDPQGQGRHQRAPGDDAEDEDHRHKDHPKGRGRHRERDHDGADNGAPLLQRDTADGHHIELGLNLVAAQHHPRRIGWYTLAVLLLFTAGAYLYLRRLLRPLDDIRTGAQRFGSGDFGQPIPVRRDDELGTLAADVNTMARHLHQMLEAKRALLLAISHELRSPLTRARLHTELLPDGPDTEPVRQALMRDLGVMRDLITDLLESERLGSGHSALHLEPTDLAALVREVVAEDADTAAEAPTTVDGALGLVDPDGPGRPGLTESPTAAPGTAPAAPRQRVTLNLPDHAVCLTLDRSRLRLLLRNLLSNAQRHSAAAQAAGAPPPHIALSPHGPGGWHLSVRDFGPGVPEDALPRLAQEPFYRPDAARVRDTGGVGLGLYLCHLVALAHGASWTLRNAGPGLEVQVGFQGPAAAAGPASP
ncbi:HAMP domain-containing sensor histidine kinase [Curvibacter sp. HBC61]|uniref:histidine kinase n=1 Tax=Curvibacter cyanobacteriorum TaxID=3026422 RepID=A0ABT5MY57_9BURK|nr:HAMP domain-containing sensor histidine kinase [Curvibacter sp. HBC61]MDD0837698.1 HAMP domain-containing sensor histidine kinase [Curvibacter sp. HBC61]